MLVPYKNQVAFRANYLIGFYMIGTLCVNSVSGYDHWKR